MSDAERLKGIDKIHADMQEELLFLRHFNNNNSVLALQRAKEQNEIRLMQKMYGVP
jgi:selenocysteine-specific translation elongation factor